MVDFNNTQFKTLGKTDLKEVTGGFVITAWVAISLGVSTAAAIGFGYGYRKR